MECSTFKFCNYLDLFSMPVALAQAKYVITAFNSKWKKKISWSMAAILHDIDVVCMCPQAIPLVIFTMRKIIHGSL